MRLADPPACTADSSTKLLQNKAARRFPVESALDAVVFFVFCGCLVIGAALLFAALYAILWAVQEVLA